MVYKIQSRGFGLAFQKLGTWPQLTSPITSRGLLDPILCQTLYSLCGHLCPPEGAASQEPLLPEVHTLPMTSVPLALALPSSKKTLSLSHPPVFTFFIL